MTGKYWIYYPLENVSSNVALFILVPIGCVLSFHGTRLTHTNPSYDNVIYRTPPSSLDDGRPPDCQVPSRNK